MMRTLLGPILALLLLAPVAAQAPPDCVCPPGTSTGPSGQPPVMVPGESDGPEGGADEPEAPAEPVGDFTQWIEQNPDSPLKGLASQAENDPGLKGVLGQLTGPELTNLGNLLSTYQTAINNHVAANPRTWDSAGGGVRNFLNSLSGLGGGDVFTRGCVDMQEQAIKALGPQTGGTHPFTVHQYNWVPGAARQYGVYGGAPIACILIAKGAGAGTAMAGPVGTLVGGTTGLVIAVSSSSTEHNMAALQSTRDPKLIIVLDPHAAQSGNSESVHGPAHYSGPTGSPELGPARVPAAAPASSKNPIDRGSVR